MVNATIITGDDIAIPVTLLKDDLVFPISGSGAVKARLVSPDHRTLYTAEVSQSRTEPGADWANSLVVVRFAPADTAAITYQGRAVLEIQVADPEKLTWFVPAAIVRGNIA